MRCRTSSPTSIKLKALEIATSSDVNTDELAGSENDRVSRPDTKAQPTPSLVFDPSAACLCRLGISILLPAPSCTPSGNSSGTHKEETSLKSLNQRLRTGRLAHARAGTRRWFSAGCALATHTRRMAISFAVRNDPSVCVATSL